MRIVWAAAREVAGLVKKIIISPANKFMVLEAWRSWKPVTSGDDHMASARGSRRRYKMDGDNRHPCQVPLEIGKVWESILEVYTFAEGEEYSASIADRMGLVKPNLSRVLCMYCQWIWLNSFSASSDKRREGSRSDPACWIISMTLLVASEAWRPVTKPDWSGLIKREDGHQSVPIFLYIV